MGDPSNIYKNIKSNKIKWWPSIYDAPMWQNGRQTRVRRGVQWATPLLARRCRVRIFFFFFFRFRIHANSRKFGSNTRRFRLNRIISTEYQCVLTGKRKSTNKEKKKKKTQTENTGGYWYTAVIMTISLALTRFLSELFYSVSFFSFFFFLESSVSLFL